MGVIVLSAVLPVIVTVMSEKDNGENLEEEATYEDENEQKPEERGHVESSKEKEQEPVPMTRKRPEPKPPSQSAATEKSTADTPKVCFCARSE